MDAAIGSVFSGIGGIDLGLEACGLGPIRWQIESAPRACHVLEKHWPNVLRFADITDVRSEWLPKVDILAGGFPCQDTSQAAHSRNNGMYGAKSGLWKHMLRLAHELAIPYIFIEHPTSGLSRWLDAVLEGLHACGYNAEWDTFTAFECGAPHLRERTFILARNANCNGKPTCIVNEQAQWLLESAKTSWANGPPIGIPLRMAIGNSCELDRVEMLGNACVPQQAQLAWQTLLARYE